MDATGFATAMASLAVLAVGITVIVVARRIRGMPLDPTSGLVLSFGIATVAMLGSLTFSEVHSFTPCQLCWWQRFAMYPSAVLLGLGLLRRDLRVRRLAIPLAAVGAAISTWHVLVQRVPTLDGGVSCDPTAPCTVVWVEPFGVFTIPTMALVGFVSIVAVLACTSTADGPALPPVSPVTEPEHA